MTCIVGWIENGEVWMGGDSAGVAGMGLALRKDPKVFRNHDFLVGYTSSFRMGQLLRFKFAPPEHPEGMDTYEYMVSHVVDAVRKCFQDGGYTRKDNERESGGCFLVGYRGRLFTLESDFQVGEGYQHFHAVGCGEDIALGALDALSGYDLTPEERVRAALQAAENWSAGVRAPFIIERLPAPVSIG